ncbi:MAG TPA: hypothetical protein VHE10_03665 [Candidatus Paceibacterota bacterium]|nr:hypothetical protein [Candidatus Paceibacterota bacterium]
MLTRPDRQEPTSSSVSRPVAKTAVLIGISPLCQDRSHGRNLAADLTGPEQRPIVYIGPGSLPTTAGGDRLHAVKVAILKNRALPFLVIDSDVLSAGELDSVLAFLSDRCFQIQSVVIMTSAGIKEEARTNEVARFEIENVTIHEKLKERGDPAFEIDLAQARHAPFVRSLVERFARTGDIPAISQQAAEPLPAVTRRKSSSPPALPAIGMVPAA